MDLNSCLADLKNFIRCPCVTLGLLAETLFVVSIVADVVFQMSEKIVALVKTTILWWISKLSLEMPSRLFDPPEHIETCLQLLRVEVLS